MKFLIVCTGYNCCWNVQKCFQSITSQTYENFSAVMISDGSTDRTPGELRKIQNSDERITTFHSNRNYGAAFQRYTAIKKSGEDEETVILLLGMDDELMPDALEEIKKKYDEGKCMTYGNWVNELGEGLPADFPLEFDKETHEARNYRQVKYRSTAPNTFKKFLFDRIPQSDFMLNGQWIDTTTESELMFSCLEMCGEERIGIIYKHIYLYNQHIRNSSNRRLGAKYKRSVLEQIMQRPKKELYVRNESTERAVA